MANAHPYPLVIDQGATWTFTFTYSVDGTAVNLSTYSGSMMVRTNFNDSATQLSLATGGLGMTLSSAGVITLTATAALTAAMTPGDCVYDIQVVSATGVVTRLLRGSVTVNSAVIR